MAEVVVAIDAGTTVVKAAVFGLDGSRLGSGRALVKSVRTPSGIAEQDMGEVWASAVEATRIALSQVPFVAVRAVGVCGQGDGAWLVDENMRPVRPAVTWLDSRARDIVAEWRAGGEADLVERVSWSGLFPGALLPILAWFARHEPDTLKRARWHLNCKDWIRYQLTGHVCTDPTDAARTALDVVSGAYNGEILGELGLASTARLLPEIRPSGEVVGVVHGAAAEATGIGAGTPVIVGMMDGPAASVGVGAISPGAGCGTIGTTASYGIISGFPRIAQSSVGFCLPQGATGNWLISMAQMDGTPVLEWLRANLASDMLWPELEALAAQVPAGSDGLLFLPYLSGSGERAPFVNPNARGGFIGMTSRHGRAAMARAVYEGIALGMADCVGILGCEKDVRISGGGAASPFLMQLMADASQLPVEVPTDLDAGLRGTAALAGVAVGAYADLSGPLNFAGESGRRYEPDPAVGDVYARLLDALALSRAALGETWSSLLDGHQELPRRGRPGGRRFGQVSSSIR